MKTAILASIILVFGVLKVFEIFLLMNLTEILATIRQRLGVRKENDEHTQN